MPEPLGVQTVQRLIAEFIAPNVRDIHDRTCSRTIQYCASSESDLKAEFLPIDQLIRDDTAPRRERPKTVHRLRLLYGKRLRGSHRARRASSEIISPIVFRSRCARSFAA
jgi:hypothetical protein